MPVPDIREFTIDGTRITIVLDASGEPSAVQVGQLHFSWDAWLNLTERVNYVAGGDLDLLPEEDDWL